MMLVYIALTERRRLTCRARWRCTNRLPGRSGVISPPGRPGQVRAPARQGSGRSARGQREYRVPGAADAAGGGAGGVPPGAGVSVTGIAPGRSPVLAKAREIVAVARRYGFRPEELAEIVEQVIWEQ